MLDIRNRVYVNISYKRGYCGQCEAMILFIYFNAIVCPWVLDFGSTIHICWSMVHYMNYGLLHYSDGNWFGRSRICFKLFHGILSRTNWSHVCICSLLIFLLFTFTISWELVISFILRCWLTYVTIAAQYMVYIF